MKLDTTIRTMWCIEVTNHNTGRSTCHDFFGTEDGAHRRAEDFDGYDNVQVDSILRYANTKGTT